MKKINSYWLLYILCIITLTSCSLFGWTENKEEIIPNSNYESWEVSSMENTEDIQKLWGGGIPEPSSWERD